MVCLVSAIVALQFGRWFMTHAGAAHRHAHWGSGTAAYGFANGVGDGTVARDATPAWAAVLAAQGIGGTTAKRPNARMAEETQRAVAGLKPLYKSQEGGSAGDGSLYKSQEGGSAGDGLPRAGRRRVGEPHSVPHTSRFDATVLRVTETCAEDLEQNIDPDGTAVNDTKLLSGVPHIGLVALALGSAMMEELAYLDEQVLGRRAAEALTSPRWAYDKGWVEEQRHQDLVDLYFAEVEPRLERAELPVRCAPVEIAVPAGMRSWGICVDAAIYASALNARIVAGLSHHSSDFFCPDTIHMTLESYNPSAVSYTRPNWRVVNHEHVMTNTEGQRQGQDLLRATDLYLTKTHYAQELLRRYIRSYGRHSRAKYVGHTSLDVYDPKEPKDWNAFVHVAGKSGLKHTHEVLQAWLDNPSFPTLTVITRDLPAEFAQARQRAQAEYNTAREKLQWWARTDPSFAPLLERWHKPGGNIIVYTLSEDRPLELALTESGPLSSEDLKTEMNAQGVHLCPSEREGFGHYINEARATGALVVTTDFAPMNELIDSTMGVLLPPDRTWRYSWQALSEGGDVNAYVSPGTIAKGVREVLAMPLSRRRQLGGKARFAYEADAKAFEMRLAAIVREHFGDSEPLHVKASRGYYTPRGSDSTLRNATLKSALSLLGDPAVWLRADATSVGPNRRTHMPIPFAAWRAPPNEYASLRWPDSSRWPEATDFAVMDGRPIRTLIAGRAAVRFDGGSCLMAETSTEVGAQLVHQGKAFAIRFRTGEDVNSRQVLWSEGGSNTGVHLYIEAGQVHLVAHANSDDGASDYEGGDDGDYEGGDTGAAAVGDSGGTVVACTFGKVTPNTDAQVSFVLSPRELYLALDGTPLFARQSCALPAEPLVLSEYVGETSVGCAAGAWLHRHARGTMRANTRSHLSNGAAIYEVFSWDRPERHGAMHNAHSWLLRRYGGLPNAPRRAGALEGAISTIVASKAEAGRVRDAMLHAVRDHAADPDAEEEDSYAGRDHYSTIVASKAEAEAGRVRDAMLHAVRDHAADPDAEEEDSYAGRDHYSTIVASKAEAEAGRVRDAMLHAVRNHAADPGVRDAMLHAVRNHAADPDAEEEDSS